MDLCCGVGISIYEIVCTVLLVLYASKGIPDLASFSFNMACLITVFAFSAFNPQSPACTWIYVTFCVCCAIICFYINCVDRCTVTIVVGAICAVATMDGVTMWGIAFLQTFNCIMMSIGLLEKRNICPQGEPEPEDDETLITDTQAENEAVSDPSETAANVENPLHENENFP